MGQENNKLHRWKFHRAGGVDQVTLRDGSDLTGLAELDAKLWVALAMPTKGIYLDQKTLEAIDVDKDGRIRLPEVLAAVKWATETLVDPGLLFKGGESLELAAIKDPAVKAGATRILVNLGRSDAMSITLADVADTAKIFAETRFNGDGVVPVESAEDDATKIILGEIITTRGEVLDRSGKPGVNQEKVDSFFTEVGALATWDQKADGAVLPLGPATTAAADALRAVRDKVDDFFTRCRLAAVDGRAALALAGGDADWAALAMKDLSQARDEVAKLPLAHVEANRALPLKEGVNPAWSDRLTAFADATVVPLLGARNELSYADWVALQAKLAAYDAWWIEKPLVSVDPLGIERVRTLHAGDGRSTIDGLIKQDLALEAESAQVAAVEKLLLFQRDLLLLLRNFVNFGEFYGRRGAVFQAGTLFLDGRGCTLCLEVADPAKHAALAAMSGAYLAYCDCTRPGGEKLGIVAAFTDGDSDNLLVGRNGIFFDRKGRDWDATITKIVANPISIREAFWAPYKKLVRLVEEQVSKRASKADTESQGKLSETATAVATADQAPAVAKKPDTGSKIDVGTVAAIGVAIGGIGAMLAGILGAFFGLGAWMPLGLVAVLLLVSGPSMLLAFLKLRQRNLGPLLDANGWAINGRARINVPFGGALTDVATLPKGAERSLKDPYAEKSRPWRAYFTLLLIFLVALAWYLGKLDHYLPEPARASHVLGTKSPAGSAAAPK
jgi:hypothetical protein